MFSVYSELFVANVKTITGNGLSVRVSIPWSKSSNLLPYKPGPIILGQTSQCRGLWVYHIWTWRKTSSRKFRIRIFWKKFVCIPKLCENFNEISGKLWNTRFWGTFSYILETVCGNRKREFWETLQIFENSEKIYKEEVVTVKFVQVGMRTTRNFVHLGKKK